MSPNSSACPCGLDRPYQDCCGALHRGRTTAATAELLMRSRFSAFVVGDRDYLLASWHATTRPPGLTLDHSRRWARLEVLGTIGGRLLHSEGTVEFRAHYTECGQADVLHEDSRFVRVNGHWVYLESIIR